MGEGPRNSQQKTWQQTKLGKFLFLIPIFKTAGVCVFSIIFNLNILQHQGTKSMDSVCHDGHGGFIDLLFPVKNWKLEQVFGFFLRNKRFFKKHSTQFACCFFLLYIQSWPKILDAFSPKKKGGDASPIDKNTAHTWESVALDFLEASNGGTKILRLPTSFYTWNCSLLSLQPASEAVHWSRRLPKHGSCRTGIVSTDGKPPKLVWLDDERMIFVYLCILYIYIYTCNYDILWYIYIYVDYIYSIYIYIQIQYIE